jgi:hypothetical protein
MKYFVKLSQSGNPVGKAHIALGGDTVCKMLSTGGMRPRSKLLETDSPRGLPVCRLCLQGAAGGRTEIPAVMPFGRHKGKPMSAVPTKDLEWMRDTFRQPPEFVHAVLSHRWEAEQASREAHRAQAAQGASASHASPASA